MSGIVGSYLNHRGSGLVAKLGTDAYQLTSQGAGKKAAIEQLATGGIADDAVTLAKMASGTDGNIISFDASGNPVAIATGSDGQILTSTGAGSPPAFEAAAGGGGKILQVAFRNTNTTMYTTSTSLTATDMYAAITPSSADSKILVMMHFRFGDARGATSTGALVGYGIHRDIGGAGYSIIQPDDDGITYNMWATTYNDAIEPVVYHKYHPGLICYDQPNTTSEVTYKLYVKTGGTSPTVTCYFGGNHNSDHTTLMEIDGS